MAGPTAALSLLALAVVVSGCAAAATANGPGQPVATAKPVELHVLAATTLRAPLEQLAPKFEQGNDVSVVYSFAASGVLEKQIEGGSQADVFVSASSAQVDRLIARDMIEAKSAAAFVSNELVIAVPSGNPAALKGPRDLTKATRLATGNPESTSTGATAQEWLRHLGVWGALTRRLVFGENAAQVTSYVSRGEVDAAVMFASEAHGRDDLEVVFRVPAEEITPPTYVIAPLSGSQNPRLAAAFAEYLATPAAQQVLVDSGFVALP